MKELEQEAKEWFANVECTTPEESFIAGANWQSEQDNWISVSERLPEEEVTDVLFYNSGYKLCFIGRLYDRIEKTFWDQSADTHTQVTHWRPLPKSPLNKGKETL